MTLHNLKPNKGARKRTQRIGRGLAGRGAKSGRGMKGQRARSGGKSGLKVKGLRLTLLRIPKTRGFSSSATKPATVTLGNLEALTLKVITPANLKKVGLVEQTRYGVKILASGALKRAVTVKGCKVTKAAKASIEAAGGTVA